MTALATRLSGLLRRMKPARTVRVSATEKPKQVTPPVEVERAATSLEELTKPEPQPKPAKRSNGGLLSRIGGRKNQRLDHLEDGYGEVVDLMYSVRERLDEQSDRSDQLMEILGRLPEAIDALPETNRNQARMLEALQTHLDRQDRQATTLNKSLSDLAQATDHQGQVMSVIQRQIEMNHKSDQEMLRGFGAMSSTLERLNESSQMSTETLERVTKQGRSSDEKLTKLMKTNTRNMTVLMAATWGLAIAAIGSAIWVGLTLSNVGGG